MQTDTLIGTVPCSAEQMATVLRAIATHLRRDGFSADTERLVNDLLFSERGVGLGLDAADFAPAPAEPARQLVIPKGFELPDLDPAYDNVATITKIHHAILGALNDAFEVDGVVDFSSGGCRAFYTPQEWRERGEQYGLNSALVVVYDGGDHAMFFDYNHECYRAIDRMNEALAKVGYYFECCTCWYSAIYPI